MKITKFGHCCLLIEVDGVRILTDPGSYSTQQNSTKNIDIILVTHEHQDHFHIDSVKAVLQNNSNAKIITNKSVGLILSKEDIAFAQIDNSQSIVEKGILIEGVGKEHAFLHFSISPIQNTGYFIANRLFYPGDALTGPNREVEILALPVAGPWLKLSEAIDYALALKPKKCFPVHDGILKQIGSTNKIPLEVLEPKGIKFMVLEIDKEYEF